MIADRWKRIYYDGNPTGGTWSGNEGHGVDTIFRSLRVYIPMSNVLV